MTRRVLYFTLELACNIGFLLLGIAMLVLQGGRSLLSNGQRRAIRFASTVDGSSRKEKEKLVILGSGWGGYNLAS